MRNISASLTKEQFYQSVELVKRGLAPVKDVTRRNGWRNAKVGERLQVCEKCQGLKKGEKMVKICVIEVVSVQPEALRKLLEYFSYGAMEVIREGFLRATDFGTHFAVKNEHGITFPDSRATAKQFVEFFCATHKGVTPTLPITRIEFKYIV